MERHATGSSYGVTIFSSSFLVAAVGLLAYYVYTRIKRAERGPEAKIIPVQMLICGILLAVAVGMVVAPLLLGTLTAENADDARSVTPQQRSDVLQGLIEEP